jgi:hypothetical protein
MDSIKEASKRIVFPVRLTAEEHAFLDRQAMLHTIDWQNKGNDGEVTKADVLRHALREYMKGVNLVG